MWEIIIAIVIGIIGIYTVVEYQRGKALRDYQYYESILKDEGILGRIYEIQDDYDIDDHNRMDVLITSLITLGSDNLKTIKELNEKLKDKEEKLEANKIIIESKNKQIAKLTWNDVMNRSDQDHIDANYVTDNKESIKTLFREIIIDDHHEGSETPMSIEKQEKMEKYVNNVTDNRFLRTVGENLNKLKKDPQDIKHMVGSFVGMMSQLTDILETDNLPMGPAIEDTEISNEMDNLLSSSDGPPTSLASGSEIKSESNKDDDPIKYANENRENVKTIMRESIIGDYVKMEGEDMPIEEKKIVDKFVDVFTDTQTLHGVFSTINKLRKDPQDVNNMIGSFMGMVTQMRSRSDPDGVTVKDTEISNEMNDLLSASDQIPTLLAADHDLISKSESNIGNSNIVNTTEITPKITNIESNTTEITPKGSD